MITGISEFLRWFSSVNRRAIRDVSVLPQEAETWRPPAGEGEAAWGVPALVEHMAASRLFFANAYLLRGWDYAVDVDPAPDRAAWIQALESSESRIRELLASTPDEWLSRRVPALDTDATISGWRVLMMMAEHDIHHRSQIDSYAGLNGWPVAQIFDRSYEEVSRLSDGRMPDGERPAG